MLLWKRTTHFERNILRAMKSGNCTSNRDINIQVICIICREYIGSANHKWIAISILHTISRNFKMVFLELWRSEDLIYLFFVVNNIYLQQNAIHKDYRGSAFSVRWIITNVICSPVFPKGNTTKLTTPNMVCKLLTTPGRTTRGQRCLVHDRMLSLWRNTSCDNGKEISEWDPPPPPPS